MSDDVRTVRRLAARGLNFEHRARATALEELADASFECGEYDRTDPDNDEPWEAIAARQEAARSALLAALRERQTADAAVPRTPDETLAADVDPQTLLRDGMRPALAAATDEALAQLLDNRADIDSSPAIADARQQLAQGGSDG